MEKEFIDRFDTVNVQRTVPLQHYHEGQKLTDAQTNSLLARIEKNLEVREQYSDFGATAELGETCWQPINGVEQMPRITNYPKGGLKALDQVIYTYYAGCTDLPEKFLTTNRLHKMCGNPMCCNPAHQLLVPHRCRYMFVQERTLDIRPEVETTMKWALDLYNNDMTEFTHEDFYAQLDRFLQAKGLIQFTTDAIEAQVEAALTRYALKTREKSSIHYLVLRSVEKISFGTEADRLKYVMECISAMITALRVEER